MTLKDQIDTLAEEFSHGILAAIRAASLEDILAEGGRLPPGVHAGNGAGNGRVGRAGVGRRAGAAYRNGAARESAPNGEEHAAAPAKRARRAGRLARRSPEQIAVVVDSVVEALRKNKVGMRSEQLQKLLKLDKKEISGPLLEALATKKITKKGQRRATTYFAR